MAQVSTGTNNSMDIVGWIIFWRFFMGLGIGAEQVISLSSYCCSGGEFELLNICSILDRPSEEPLFLSIHRAVANWENLQIPVIICHHSRVRVDQIPSNHDGCCFPDATPRSILRCDSGLGRPHWLRQITRVG